MRTGGRSWQLRKKKDDQPLCWLKAGNALQNVQDSSLPEARGTRNVSGFIMDKSWFSLCLPWKLCCRNPKNFNPALNSELDSSAPCPPPSSKPYKRHSRERYILGPYHYRSTTFLSSLKYPIM